MVFPTLLFGVAMCATAVILIKVSTQDPILLASWRTLLAALVLSPLFIRDLKKFRSIFPISTLSRMVLPSVVLAVHFITWNIGARLSPAANAALLVNLAPLALPFMLSAFASERITRREWIGTAVAVAGVIMLTGGDFVIGGELWRGNLVCLFSMLCFSAYLATGRHNRTLPSIWLYVVPVYAICGVLCLIVALSLGIKPTPISSKEWLTLAGLVLLPTIIGHTALNFALKHLRGQLVSLVNLGQFLFSGLYAILLFNEWPPVIFYPASAFIIFGAIISLKPSLSNLAHNK